MLNYEVDPKLLSGYVPPGTVLDSFHGRTYISLVGFRFRRTKLFGFLPIPFHADFDEVNLRLYVRRKEGEESRRGVVFIAEIVPKWAVAQLARAAYGENYVRLPMQHSIHTNGASNAVEYKFQLNGAWCKLHAQSSVAPAPANEGSLEQFITEHYWGYSAQSAKGAARTPKSIQEPIAPRSVLREFFSSAKGAARTTNRVETISRRTPFCASSLVEIEAPWNTMFRMYPGMFG